MDKKEYILNRIKQLKEYQKTNPTKTFFDWNWLLESVIKKFWNDIKATTYIFLHEENFELEWETNNKNLCIFLEINANTKEANYNCHFLDRDDEERDRNYEIKNIEEDTKYIEFLKEDLGENNEK